MSNILSLTYLITYLLTNSLTHLLNYLLTNSLTYLLTNSLTYYLQTYLLTYMHTYLLTYFMEQSLSWEAKRFSASQEIACVLWKLKVYCRIHKCLPLVPILSQINPVHAPPSLFVKIHLKIILTSNSGSSKWSFSFRFPHQNPVYASPFPLLHFPPTSFFSIWLPEKYLLRITDN